MDWSRFREAYLQGCVDPSVASCYWKDSPSPPPAPDYTGAAQATAAGNIEAARAATKANRVNQSTPYGSITYQQNPGDQDLWSSNISLTPTGQQLLDAGNQSALGLAGMQGQALNRVGSSLSQPFDYNSVGQLADQSYADQTARLDPQWTRNEDQLRTRLANQGVVAGGEAYDNEMRNFNQARNDAYTQARQAALATMPQTFQLSSSLRNQPLNELNALRTGSQVTNPTFTPIPQQQTTAGPNLLGAAQAQGQYDQGLYNANVAQNNAFMSGLMGIGGTIAGLPTMGGGSLAGKLFGF